jgi:hypothetical protein
MCHLYRCRRLPRALLCNTQCLWHCIVCHCRRLLRHVHLLMEHPLAVRKCSCHLLGCAPLFLVGHRLLLHACSHLSLGHAPLIFMLLPCFLLCLCSRHRRPYFHSWSLCGHALLVLVEQHMLIHCCALLLISHRLLLVAPRLMLTVQRWSSKQLVRVIKKEARKEHVDGGGMALDRAKEQACHQLYTPQHWGSLAGSWHTT